MDELKRHEQAQQMLDYIAHEVIRRADIEITKETPLVSSGLMDSLALVGVLTKLEDVTRLRIPVGKVQPKDMDTVALMLATAQRLGKPRN
jgi:acyl carrier protein